MAFFGYISFGICNIWSRY